MGRGAARHEPGGLSRSSGPAPGRIPPVRRRRSDRPAEPIVAFSPPPWVADSSSLLALTKVQRTELLALVYRAITIPPAVHGEIALDPSALAMLSKPWLSISAPLEPAAVQRLRDTEHFGAGEAEAILLAQQIGSGLIIDDARGRRAARRAGLEFTGSLGVLVSAQLAGVLGLLVEARRARA